MQISIDGLLIVELDSVLFCHCQLPLRWIVFYQTVDGVCIIQLFALGVGVSAAVESKHLFVVE